MPGQPGSSKSRVDKCRTGCRRDSDGKVHRCAEHAKLKKDQAAGRRRAAEMDKGDYPLPRFITDDEAVRRLEATNLAEEMRMNES